MGIISPDTQDDDEGIDVKKDPSPYEKDFDPKNPDHFAAWLKMRPTHMSQDEWQSAVAELKLLLTSNSVQTEDDKSMLMIGWRSKYGLLSEK